MKFTASLKTIRLDLQKYKEQSHRFFTWCLAGAARDWLHATADTLPVYGGASRATFGPLASLVTYTLDISPIVGPNTVTIGTENGTAEFKTENNKYTFTYYTTLPHLIVNEYFNANDFKRPNGEDYFHLTHPGPYHFQERGAKAFLRSISTLVMPPLYPCVVIKQFTV